MKRAAAALLVLCACSGAPPKPEVRAQEEKPAPPPPPVPEIPALPEGVKPADAAPPPPAAPQLSDDAEKQLRADATRALAEADNDKAEALLGRILQGKPDDAVVSDNLTRLRLKTNKLAVAERDLASRIAQVPASLPLRVQYVRVLIAEGRLDAALLEAKKVLKSDERNVPALLALADVWYREKKYELARDVLDNAAAIEPKNAEIANAQGFIHLAMDQKPLALEDFKKACALGPLFAEAHNNLGALYNEASDFEAATAELVQAVKIEPDRAAMWLNLGNAHRGAKRYEEAEQAYRRSLELSPQNPDPLFNLGILYLDGDLKNKPVVDRLSQSVAFFAQFRKAGGTDARLVRYEEEAGKVIKKERDRLAREEREKMKKIEAQRKVEDALKKREQGKLGHEKEEDEGPTPGAPVKPTSGKLSGEEEK